MSKPKMFTEEQLAALLCVLNDIAIKDADGSENWWMFSAQAKRMIAAADVAATTFHAVGWWDGRNKIAMWETNKEPADGALLFRPSPTPQLHAGMLICQECGTDRVDPRSVCPKGADYRCPMIARA